MIAAAVAAMAMLAQGPAARTDPTFELAKRMVGGRWSGHVGKAMPVEFVFKLEDGGNKVVGYGVVHAPKADVRMRSSLGWDPDAKQMYYLDEHSYDTAYFGHVTRDGDDLVFDFRGLVNDSGHYRSRCHVEGDTYTNVMEVEKAGKWSPTGLHVEMTRRR